MKKSIILAVIIICLANIVHADNVTTTQTNINFVAGASFNITYTLQYNNPNPSICHVSTSIIPDGTGFSLSYPPVFSISQGTSAFTIRIDTDHRLAPGNYTLTANFIAESTEPIVIKEIKTVEVSHEVIRTVYVNNTIPGKETTKYINQTIYKDKIITKYSSIITILEISIVSICVGILIALIIVHIIYKVEK